MSTAGRGCIAIAIIGFAVLIYFLFIVGVEEGGGGSISHGTVENYLNERPEIHSNAKMIQGAQSPDFTYATMSNEVIRLSDYIGNKPVVLDFWATRCPPCRKELPVLQGFYSQHKDQVEIIAITNESANMKNSISAMVSQSGIEFPVMHDPSGNISRLFPHRYIPFLVFIDIDGNVVETERGYNPQIGEEIIRIFGL